MIGCGGGDPVKPPPAFTLTLLSTDSLSIAEPSDLTINPKGTALWTVTNNPARVYKLDLHGRVTKRLNYHGVDLEGIAYDVSDSTLWVAEEVQRAIVHLDLDGNVLSRTLIDLPGEPNHGPEGLCLNAAHQMFVLNEQNPGMFVELNPDLTILRREILSFAQDYSGLAARPFADQYWIVSDLDQKLILWNKQSGVIGEQSLPYPKAEGVACNEAAHLIYIISDSEQKLYTYRVD